MGFYCVRVIDKFQGTCAGDPCDDWWDICPVHVWAKLKSLYDMLVWVGSNWISPSCGIIIFCCSCKACRFPSTWRIGFLIIPIVTSFRSCFREKKYFLQKLTFDWVVLFWTCKSIRHYPWDFMKHAAWGIIYYLFLALFSFLLQDALVRHILLVWIRQVFKSKLPLSDSFCVITV